MYDPEFERQVRSKMDELRFSPSDAVWNKVQRQISLERKRKRPLAWFFLFAALCLAGASVFFIEMHQKPVKPVVVNPATSTASNEKVNPGPGDPIHSDEKVQSHVMASLPGHALANSEVKNAKQVKQVGQSISNNHPKRSETSFTTKQDPSIVRDRVNHLDQEQPVAPPSGTVAKHPSAKKVNAATGPGDQPSVIVESASGTAVLEKAPAKNGVTPPPGQAAQKESALKKDAAAATQQQKIKSSSWSFGATGSAGISNVFQTSGGKSVAAPSLLYNPAYYYNANNTTSVVLGAAPPPPANNPTIEQPGFSFSLGAFAKKSISRTIYFTLGLSYHFYSSSIQTGNKVNDNSLSLAAGAPAYLYGSTNTYHNNYQFLDIPVMAGYRITSSRKFPLSAEAGLSLSQLISSNALHYDVASSTYIKNNALLNKTQVMGSAALLVGYSTRKLIYQFGPQVQYGLANLLSSTAGNKEHLFFGGIKIQLQLNK